MLALYSPSFLALVGCKCFSTHSYQLLRLHFEERCWAECSLPSSYASSLPSYEISNMNSLVPCQKCFQTNLSVLRDSSQLSLHFFPQEQVNGLIFFRAQHIFCRFVWHLSHYTLSRANIILKEKAKPNWQCPVLCVPIPLVLGEHCLGLMNFVPA